MLTFCFVFPEAQVMQEELGRPVGEVFSEITPEPVAAASLGQVRSCRARFVSGGLSLMCLRLWPSICL